MYLLYYQLLFYPFFFLYSFLFIFIELLLPVHNVQQHIHFSLLYPLLILPNFTLFRHFFFHYLKFFCNAVVSACQPNHILCFYFFFQKFQKVSPRIFPILKTEGGLSSRASRAAAEHTDRKSVV